MKKALVLLAIFVFLLTAAAFAETSIKAEVDKTSITTDDTIVYKLIISSDEKNIPQPEFPKFEGYKVLSSAETSQIRFAKGIQKAGVIYVFILSPGNLGKIKIEPSVIKIGNKTYSTDAFEIEVTQGKARPEAKPKATPQKPSLPEMPQPERESEEPQITL